MDETFDVAHLNIQDVKVVVVFVDRAVDASAYAALQRAASAAGLDGDVVAVWPDEYGRTGFLAYPERHAFFRAAGYDQLRAQINAKLNAKVTAKLRLP